MKKSALIDTITYSFVLLFVYTAANKVWKFHNFDWVLSTLPFIGSFHTLLAYTIVSTEILTAMLLLYPDTKKYGLICSFLLLLVFSTYLIFMVLSTRTLPCNCGGVISHLSWGQHIAFNLFFLLLSLIALKFQSDLKSIKHY